MLFLYVYLVLVFYTFSFVARIIESMLHDNDIIDIFIVLLWLESYYFNFNS